MVESGLLPILWFTAGAVTALLSMWLGLVSLAYEVEQWLRRLRSAELLNGPPLEEPSPMGRINAIADLFVPELKAEVKRLNTAAVAFETWVEQAAAEKRSQRSVSQVTLERYAEVQRAVLERVNCSCGVPSIVAAGKRRPISMFRWSTARPIFHGCPRICWFRWDAGSTSWISN